MVKSLDQKLEALRADPSGCREFIICDAKDADMAFGAVAAGEYNSPHLDRCDRLVISLGGAICLNPTP